MQSIQEWIKLNDEDRTLDLSGMDLLKLPKLPKNLRRLNCSNNLLKEIDSSELPKNLEVLDCSYNYLQYIPMLPECLSVLVCSHNHITGLPDIPRYLTTLVCCNNKLTDLDGMAMKGLPETLLHLDCSFNKIKKIELTPSLKTLIFSGNPIKEIFNLPLSTRIAIKNRSNPLLASLQENPDIIIVDNGEEVCALSRSYILENIDAKYYIKDFNLQLDENIYSAIVTGDESYYQIL